MGYYPEDPAQESAGRGGSAVYVRRHCAISMLPYNYPEQLRRYGIQCKMSNAVRPFLSTTQNNRDHRKICVIDGKVGFTGGINWGMSTSTGRCGLDTGRTQP